jgi:hypothetical protein
MCVCVCARGHAELFMINFIKFGTILVYGGHYTGLTQTKTRLERHSLWSTLTFQGCLSCHIWVFCYHLVLLLKNSVLQQCLGSHCAEVSLSYCCTNVVQGEFYMFLKRHVSIVFTACFKNGNMVSIVVQQRPPGHAGCLH